MPATPTVTPAIAWVTAHARRRPDAVAIRQDDRVVPWKVLAEESLGLAAALARHGVTRGDLVAVRMKPQPRMVAMLHALQMLGAAMLPLNLRLTDEELARIVGHAAPRLLVDETDSAGGWYGELARIHPFDDLDPRVVPKTTSVAGEIDPEAALTVVLTSGSSAAPKAVVLTNANHAASAAASRARLGHGERDVWLATLPFFHVGGLAILTRSALEGSQVLVETAFDVDRAVAALSSRTSAEERPTIVSLVPTMLSRVLDRMTAPASAALRCVLVGGASLSPALGRRALEAGMPVSATYGMTEACSQIATSVPGSEDAALGLVGRPLDGVEVRIADSDTDGWGEILVRGANVMRGYLRNDEANAAALEHGWLRTGDLGRLDERGSLAVQGRRSDLLITGGENVSPLEVERVLDEHPDVAESLVVGVEDDEWGQRIVALVVAKDGRAPTAENLYAWCRARIAAYKTPREVRFVPELPRGATGKVLRTRNVFE